MGGGWAWLLSGIRFVDVLHKSPIEFLQLAEAWVKALLPCPVFARQMCLKCVGFCLMI